MESLRAFCHTPQRPLSKSKTGQKQEKRKQRKKIEEEKEDEEGVPIAQVPIAQGIAVEEDDGGARYCRKCATPLFGLPETIVVWLFVFLMVFCFLNGLSNSSCLIAVL